MNGLWELTCTVYHDESGQDMIEYGLVVGCLALACVAGMKSLASNISTFFGTVGNTLTNSL